MSAQITAERLAKYFDYTARALGEAREAIAVGREEDAAEVLDTASRYFSDAQHFEKKGDWVTAFAALNYAHGWLDCGARLKLFTVTNNYLFAVDGN